MMPHRFAVSFLWSHAKWNTFSSVCPPFAFLQRIACGHVLPIFLSGISCFGGIDLKEAFLFNREQSFVKYLLPVSFLTFKDKI